MKTLRLKPGRERSLKLRHPWIFSGALAALPEGFVPGETVRIESTDGAVLALGAVSPASQITVRIWSFDRAEKIDAAFFHGRLARAIQRRADLAAATACRLVNAEADQLPGLIVDRYGEFLVCQFLSAGAARWRAEIVAALAELCAPRGIFERSDSDSRSKEGLAPETGVLHGDEPPALLEVEIAGLKFLVDPRHGHKTGFYLDQSANLAIVAGISAGREILNCFSYTGAFSVAALAGGARHAVNVDSSRAALELAAQNLALNGIAPEAASHIEADIFTELRKFRDAGRQFDLVVLDPPKFVANAGQLQRGSRAYKDINLLGIKLLRPGGVLATFSCSGHVPPDLFQKIVADAALDAGREVQVQRPLSQAPDHPVALNFPQAHYLKGLLCRVD